MLLVTGASAAKFVIKDKDASLSLAATSDHEVAFSVVVAENPDSYSASMSADDSSGASASQESSVGGADFIFSATAAVGPEGDSAYTATETYDGSTETNQEAHASQGNSASVSQDTTSVAVAGASVSNATDSDGNTASQCIAFLLGVNNVNLTADTGNSATASQSGLFVGLFAHTLGFAETTIGDASYTDALVGAGGMTFDNTATAAETTSASQDLGMAGAFGFANARSIDHEDNLASQSVGFVGGVLAADQSTNTDHSATASQSGTFAGLTGGTLGLAMAKDGDVSETDAGVLIGGMTFDDTATAQDTSTSASQDVLMAGLLGSAHAGSIDQNGNIAGQSAAFTAGVLGADQTADTLNSASASQEGGYIGLGGATADGFARSADDDISITHAGVISGVLPALMTFDSTAKAQNVNTSASQDVVLAGLLGSATAVSVDQSLNIASQSDAFTAGVLVADQTVDTLDSASASQEGGYIGLGGATADGFARSADSDISITHAGVIGGGLPAVMTFDNTAKAQDVNTTASQDVVLAGLLGSATAVSVDQNLNIASQSDAFTAGVLSADQTVDTFDSATASQEGGYIGLGGATADGFARSTDGDVSITHADVLTGGMTFDNTAKAQYVNTSASQDVILAGLLGSATAVSVDQSLNIASQSDAFTAGVLSADQTVDTLDSASASQEGGYIGLGGATANGFARSTDGDVSITHADVLTGGMTFDNTAKAQYVNTSASQDVVLAGLLGSATSVSVDQSLNIASQSDAFTAGVLSADQTVDTFDSATASQEGGYIGLGGATADGFARSTDGDVSITHADIIGGGLPAVMTFDNTAKAQYVNTSASQDVVLAGLFGDAVVSSSDGTNNATVGSRFSESYLNMNQMTNTGGSAYANQTGFILGVAGNTWGTAASGANRSWTSANVTAGLLTMENNTVAASGSTSARQDLNIAALGGDAWVGSTDGTNIVGIGANLPSGLNIGDLNFDQMTNTGGSAYANQTGSILGVAGNTWGTAASGSNRSWTSANVTAGLLTMENNTVVASGSTSARQDLNIAALGGDAWVGSTDGTNTVGIGATLPTDQFNIGDLNFDQMTRTGGSAYANQTGFILGAAGNTWGTATSGANRSWTSANVTSGAISVTSNKVYAGSTTIANQSIFNAGVSGSASVGSSDGINNATVGAGYSNVGSLSNSIVGLTGEFTQQTNTGGSAFANQSGVVVAGSGNTWGEATSGPNRSWTLANVTSGLISVTSNKVYAGSTTIANQSIFNAGVSGSASVGSSDGINNATVGAGYSNVGSLSNSIVGLTGEFTQQTNTLTSTNAHQEGYIASIGTTLGSTWTRIAAGNKTGRLTYVETKGQAVVIGITFPSIIRERDGTASASNNNAKSYEDITRTSGASTTYAFATNGILSDDATPANNRPRIKSTAEVPITNIPNASIVTSYS